MPADEGNILGSEVELVLILGGGNALGAFEAGVCEALHESGLEPDWIVGTSIGAINGALIAGSETQRRVETLRRFWNSPFDPFPAWTPISETLRRTFAANWTITVGRPGIFGPILSGAAGPSIYQTAELRRTLLDLVDFERLNYGPCRFTATAVDLETGDDVAFDSATRRIEQDHVRASAALPVLFPPVEIEGRWHVDGGVSANLPLDPFFMSPPSRPTLCIAVDLLPLRQRPPRTIGEAASRMQDLLFAAQSRRLLTRWREAYASRRDPGIAFARLAYAEQDDEVVGKALDFSAGTVGARWHRGHDRATDLLKAIRGGDIPLQGSGLRVHELDAREVADGLSSQGCAARRRTGRWASVFA